MNTKFTSSIPLAVSINPFTGYKVDFYSFYDFEQSCIDLHNFKIKPDTYIHPEFAGYDCEGCSVLAYVNPKNLSEVVGYAINGYIKKYDIDQTPHKLLDSQKVAWIVGTTGVFASNTDKANIYYVLGTDNLDLFIKIAKTGATVVFHKDIDQAYQLINYGMPETIFRAMTGFNQPKQNQDLFIKLDKSFKVFQQKQVNEFFLKKINLIKQTIDPNSYIHEPVVKWEKLLPIVQAESPSNDLYPIDALSPLAREAAIAIAEYVQAPIAMTAQCIIGAMSHIAQANVNAPIDRHNSGEGEPCSLYLLTEGQSGSRKSTSRNMAEKAIIKHEHKQYELYHHELEQWKSRYAGLNKRDREAFCAENPPPQDPSMLYSDITFESIASLYVDRILDNASIASDEAGQFFGGYTMQGKTRSQAISGYAKLFDNGFVDRTRSKSNLNGSGRAYDVRLTINLQGQHEVLVDALTDPMLRGQGFLPRFILTVPENLAGTRLQDSIYRTKNANTDPRLIAYWTRCEYLLSECPKPLQEQSQHHGRYVIPINNEAKKVDEFYYNYFEISQLPNEPYEYIQAFASRACQLARRLATVFAYFEGLPNIDAKTLTGACEIMKHSLSSWLMYKNIEVKVESDAERLSKWLIRKCLLQKTDKLPYSYMQTSCPRPMQKNKNLLEMIVQQLEDSHHIKIESFGRTRYVVINPILLKS